MSTSVIDLDALLLKAKIEIMTKSVFISTIALSVRHIISDDVPTAQTNGTSIWYGTKFIEKLTAAQLAGLMAHECWHIAFQHVTRRNGRQPVTWNIAGDHVINLMLLKNAFELPPKGYANPAYADLGTDEIYDILLKENPQGMDPKGVMLDIMEPASEENGDEASSEGKGPKPSDITDILVRAHTQSRIAGKDKGEIPGEILRVIDKLLNPQIPWEIVLNRFLDRRVQEKYNWNRRNRRHKVYMPSLHSLGLGHLVFGIDTSGSQSDAELQQILSEIRGIQQTFNPEKMTIIDCDARIHNIFEIDAQTDILSLKFTGSGGTSFLPVLDYMEDHPAQALVYFTDLYGETELEPVTYPILWICNSKHDPAPIGETVYIE